VRDRAQSRPRPSSQNQGFLKGQGSALRAMTWMALLKAWRFGLLYLVRGGGLAEEPLEVSRRVPAVHAGDRERCLVPGALTFWCRSTARTATLSPDCNPGGPVAAQRDGRSAWPPLPQAERCPGANPPKYELFTSS
jgi:hypothetical protein